MAVSSSEDIKNRKSQKTLILLLDMIFSTAVTSEQIIGKGPSWSQVLRLIEFFSDLTIF